MTHKKLLVITHDKLSELVEKGEITERYYNPGNLFEEVHILVLKDDVIDPGEVKKTAGSARLILHNLSAPSFRGTLCWNRWLVKKWLSGAINVARNIDPALVRCYGNSLNAYLAANIRKVLGVPYAVSIHTQPDENKKIVRRSLKQILAETLVEDICRVGIREADVVLPVYKCIIPYLERRGVKNIEVVYNALDDRIKRKKKYLLSNPVKIISVGRQIPGKNPEQLIRAVSLLNNVKLTLVGDGTYHEHLKSIARNNGLSDHRVEFIQAIPNESLCNMLADFDIFAAHSDYCGIPKAVMEPLLAGLPLVINKPLHTPVAEYNDDCMLLVDNTSEGYRDALKKLMEDDNFRKTLGERGRSFAISHWLPEAMEEKVVNIYKRLLLSSPSAQAKHD